MQKHKLRGNNYFVGLDIIWALFGVESKRQTAGGDGAQNITTAAWIAIGLIFAAIAIQAVRQRKKLPGMQ